MSQPEPSRPSIVTGKLACALVLVLMLASLVYVAATALSQYASIGV